MTELDGFQLYGFFKAGTERIRRARDHMDRINVFPVADGDTGTNLFTTLAGALEQSMPQDSAAETLNAIAAAVIETARGNSGVMFAQFISGFSESVCTARVRTQEFADAVQQAGARVRAAIDHPRDGTILSVIEEWSVALQNLVPAEPRFDKLIGKTRPELRWSLNQTRNRQPELSAAGVVDAGAFGFVEFIEGGHDFLLQGADPETTWSRSLLNVPSEWVAPEEEPVMVPIPHEGKPRYRYCAEAMLTSDSLNPEAIRRDLSCLGDSLIVTGGTKKARIHIHTDNAVRFVSVLSEHGSVSRQKVDDLWLQYVDIHAPKARVAIVTDSSCDLPPELLDQYGIHVVPLVLTAGDKEYLDKITIDADLFWKLAESRVPLPKTSQPSPYHFERLYDFLASHYEAVISIHLASALSGTFESAKRAAVGRPSVYCIDSKHLSGSLGLMVLRAAEAAMAGASADEITSNMPIWASKARNLVSVSSLRYMVRGGRVSPLKGVLARMLNLKPIVSIDCEGRSLLMGKAFSERANFSRLKKMTVAIHNTTPLRNYAIVHAQAEDKAKALAEEIQESIKFPPLYIMEISSVIALNAGPGAVSIVTMAE